ncbi:MAG: hypothetical protein KDD11_10830 [Acidobacteria bacterium]|nr:hypothetical protein [Acidobacteriota bacterium]
MPKTPSKPASADDPAAPSRNRWLAVLLAWLVPGAGHVYLGRRTRGLYFLIVVSAAIFVGVKIGGGLSMAFDAPLQKLGTLASMGMGLPYFVLRFVAGYTGDLARPGFEYGAAFLLSAGLMNLLLILDTWDVANGRRP